MEHYDSCPCFGRRGWSARLARRGASPAQLQDRYEHSELKPSSTTLPLLEQALQRRSEAMEDLA